MSHYTREFKNYNQDSLVLLLNTESVIGEEARAMLCALYSRSPDSILNHLDVVKKRGADKFMQSYYVGYGHQSIGDNTASTIFVENVSMLAAKVLQQNPLYAGQEVSTRYVDFAKQTFLNPEGSKLGEDIQEGWRNFYIKHLPLVAKNLQLAFPVKEGENEKVWEKAIMAKAFDVMRGFLPAGACTSVAYHSSLRVASDHLMVLRNHPLKEVQDIHNAMYGVLADAFPSSFSHKKYQTTEDYINSYNKQYYYHSLNVTDDVVVEDFTDHKYLSLYKDVLSQRPIKTELPLFVNAGGSVVAEFLLDFASFRDLQRHRAVYQPMPLLSSDFGMHDWYLDQLSPVIRNEAEEFIAHQLDLINRLQCDQLTKQYYLPMGMKVSCRLSGPLGKMVYLVELRATKFVHPTLAKKAYQLGQRLQAMFAGLELALHLDKDYIAFDIKRGTQDIVKKDGN